MKKLIALICCVLIARASASRQFNGTTDVITVAKTIITAANIQSSVTGWKPVCVLPTCNPGGSVPPTSTNQTFGNASPSLSGSSMQVSITGPAFSNALWTRLTGSQDNTIKISHDFHFFLSANATRLGSAEFDSFIFDKTHNTNFMFGTQCNFVNGLWQIWNQLNNVWINTPVTCTLVTGSWQEVALTGHRIPGDTNGCSGQPCQCFDNLTINGSAHAINVCEPSGPLDPTFASQTGTQVQLDIGGTGSAGSPITENIDNSTVIMNAIAADVIDNFTILGWFNPTVIPTTEADFLSRWGTTNGNQYLFNLSQTSTGHVGVAYGEAGVPSIVNYFCGTTLTVANVWHHIASTWNTAGGVTNLYLDGTFCATVATHGPLISNGQGTYFGARDTGVTQPFNGKLCEWGIYSKILNLSQIASAAKGVPLSRIQQINLVAYYPFYGAISPESDLSRNKQNGALTGTSSANHCPVGN